MSFSALRLEGEQVVRRLLRQQLRGRRCDEHRQSTWASCKRELVALGVREQAKSEWWWSTEVRA